MTYVLRTKLVKVDVMFDLSKVRERECLPPRREPYWQRLRPGCFVGYRPSLRGGLGTWIARTYDGDARSYKLKALGGFGGAQSRERFVVAKQAAEAFSNLVEGGGFVERHSIRSEMRANIMQAPMRRSRRDSGDTFTVTSSLA